MESLTGREIEKEILENALSSPEAELIAIYGRRRVGKTFLVRKVYDSRIIMDVSGIHNGTLSQQLINFNKALELASSRKRPLPVPSNWIEAFFLLEKHLTPLIKRKKSVLFFDEFPWMNSRRSGFLPAFENFWNRWASRQENLVVVICGSAASWMIKHVMNNRGGLHNRITQRVRLLPFTLYETEKYLQGRRIKFSRYQLLQLYMVMGGIPQYLKNVKIGESATQSIDRVCFTKDGALFKEFDNLYHSLFEYADNHIKVVRALAGKSTGLSRNQIIQICKLQTGGGTTKLLNELEESGFISSIIPFDKNVSQSIYRLSDEYSLFYIKFIESHKEQASKGAWMRLAESSSWKSWSGYAFENICMKHIDPIKKALGISGVYSITSAWRYQNKEKGAQIDLLIDRQDQCINICEMKFSINDFTITRAYATDLEKKMMVFKEQTKTRKSMFLTMITTFGVKNNPYKINLVQNELKMDELFKAG